MPIACEENVPEVVRQLVQSGAHIYEVEIIRPTLEDIYFSLTKER